MHLALYSGNNLFSKFKLKAATEIKPFQQLGKYLHSVNLKFGILFKTSRFMQLTDLCLTL